MSRILVGALVCALAIPLAVAEAGAVGARSLPMQFEWHHEGPAEVCGTQCRTWVSAIGTITAETSHEFAEFSRQHDLHGALLVLDSGGGSVHGAMALGRLVRQLGMATAVGKTIELEADSAADKPRAELSPHADCESMCVFVLLAGTNRDVPRGARVLVHQIWLGDRRDDAAAATYSAEDLVLVQRDIGRLAQYTVEMGGSIDFLELTLRIPPWEPMRVLTREEIGRMRVASESRPRPLQAKAAEAGTATAASSPSLTSGARREPDAKTRGWIAVTRSAQPLLIRTHPLTVEGAEIGTFDLTLACGDKPGSLDVGYSERRTGAAASQDRLTSVSLSLSGRFQTLRVVSSEPLSSLELSTQARGHVPISFIRSFSELSSRALVVSTESVKESRTAIRVGNSGINPAFARLQRDCGSRQLHATNARTGIGDRR